MARLVGLEPLPLDDQLRDGALADMANHFRRSSGIEIDVNFGIGDSVGIEELFGGSAIAAPCSRVDPDVHALILPLLRCYHRERMTAEEIKSLLKLEPHPIEGGCFRRTYTSTATVQLERGVRAQGTAIYYLLEAESFSEMHVLDSDEIFHFYLGDPVEMLQLHPDGRSSLLTLGPDLAAGQYVQVVVPD